MINKIASQETRLVLTALALPGVGPAALRRLIAASSSSKDHNIMAGFIENELNGKDEKTVHDKVSEQLSDCEKHNIFVLSPFDKGYPSRLKAISDYPPILYVKGDIDAMRCDGFAVVGTREASKLGMSWAKQIASIVCEYQLSVVSGLALGIDSAAHEGALKVGGRTIAVLAHGLDRVTPARNKDLAEQILGGGGALVSEHAPGVPPRKAEYVRRNRIQSGMSLCSIIVESGETGGAMHQGKFTRDQGHPLFCTFPDESVRGSGEFNYNGAKKLISEMNAKPIADSTELKEFIDSEILKIKDINIYTKGEHGFGF